MIKIAIVEDEAAVRDQLTDYVRRYTRQYGTEFEVTCFTDGDEILENYRPAFDIIFLDVEMKRLNGMETAQRIRELDDDVLLIFITNMAQYAIKGYSVGALDYVLKPVPYFAFSQQLQKAVNQLARRARHYLAVPVDGGMRRLDTAAIYYMESDGHKVCFYTEDGDFIAPGALKAFEEKLANRPFARCNSGYLVNLAQVRGVQQSTVNSLIWMAGLAVFMQLTGSVPLMLWLPCMVAAIGSMYLFLWRTCETTPLEAGYYCARAFILAELAASVEWQLHCALWPQRTGRDPLAVLLLVLVYGVLFTAVYWMEKRRSTQPAKLHITPLGMLMAVIMAITVFAVSNLSFVNNNEATMSIRYIRTLVDLAGVLILTVQHEQLRESALHSELTAMDDVLRRQYEQYRQSKENIKLINRRYHELKVQIATIRAERDQAKQDAALAAMESDIRRYEAENKTGNPVLDTLLTAKSLYCQQHGINMTCVADGKLLDFLSTGEICTIVGTALDNATESVAAEPDPEKKLIRVAIYAQNGFVMLRFENYCAQPVELGPDGLPLRSAHGGYDLKSVRAAAEAHGGTLTLHWENEWFTLRVLLPQK